MHKFRTLRVMLSVIIGALLFSAAMNMFLLPSGIVLGGMTGIATVVHLFFGFPVGITILCLNVPLIFLNARRLGRSFVIKTLVGVAATSAASDLIIISPISTAPLTAAILGGILVGISAGMLLARGFTTGGTDLVALLMREILPGLTLGSAITLADSVIILGAAWITGNYSGIFHSIACAVFAGISTDMTMRLHKFPHK